MALAATYGEGTYGEGIYNVGAVPADPDETPVGSQTSTPACSAQVPGKAPWLYAAVTKSSSSIEIYFTDSGDPYDHYALEYGPAESNYQWGATNIGGKGTRTYTISDLSPNTTYYFRVRAGNGCATGAWSNELSATTKSRFWGFSGSSLDTESIDVATSGGDTNVELGQDQDEAVEEGNEGQAAAEPGYRVKIKVVDEEKKAVLGASVTLYSTPREAATDENGVAIFDNVEPGEHRVVVAFNGQSGEQKINISGDEETEEIDFTIQIRETSPFTNPWVIGVVAGLAFLVILIALLYIKSRRAK